jgi:hypothetical protein
MDSRRSMLTASLLVAVSLVAAGRQIFDRPLTDADIQKLIPLLKVDADGQDRLRAEAERKTATEKARQAARDVVVGRVGDGGVDPFAWLREQSPSAAVPSTARYEASCSREMTAARGDVTAVFTFGVPAPAPWLSIVRGTGATEAAPASGGNRPRGPSAEAIAQQTRAFYAAKTFEPQGEPAPFQWVFLAPDELVMATVYGVKPGPNAGACGTLASGPMILLAPAPKAFGAKPAPSAAATPRAGGLEDALRAAGLAEAEYQSLRFQVTMARRDAREPAALEAGAGVQPPTEQARREKSVRRQNADTYGRFAGQLDPLLDRLR